MDIEYPDGHPEHIKGYSQAEIDGLMKHYHKAADIAFESAKDSEVNDDGN